MKLGCTGLAAPGPEESKRQKGSGIAARRPASSRARRSGLQRFRVSRYVWGNQVQILTIVALLHVEISDIQRIASMNLRPRFNSIAHQHSEQVVRLDDHRPGLKQVRF